MLRARFFGLLLCSFVLLNTAASYAQTKSAPAPARPAASQLLDINSAVEDDIAAMGIDRAVAKKIIAGRPYRSKLELVSRQILTREQYDQFKDSLIARQATPAR